MYLLKEYKNTGYIKSNLNHNNIKILLDISHNICSLLFTVRKHSVSRQK